MWVCVFEFDLCVNNFGPPEAMTWLPHDFVDATAAVATNAVPMLLLLVAPIKYIHTHTHTDIHNIVSCVYMFCRALLALQSHWFLTCTCTYYMHGIHTHTNTTHAVC